MSLDRVTLVAAVMVATSLVAPVVASADEPPCAAEAAAVKQMTQRDASLRKPTSAEAGKHLDAGARAFGVGEYETAISEYTAAGLVDDAPLILYNLGQTYRAAKDYEKAIRQYKLFIERGGPGDEVRALVECHIATMKAELDRAASTAPPQGPASDHAADVGTDPRANTSAATGGSDRADVPPRRSRWTTKRRIGAGLGAAGLVGLGAGIVFGVQTSSLKDDAARLCPSEPCANADQANEISRRADNRATLANYSAAAGAALAVGAVVLWYVGAPSSTSAHDGRVTLMPQVTPTFAGIMCGGRF